jgi:hypothetical protein
MNYFKNLNVHATIEDKSDDTTDSFYEELQQPFRQLLKYHMKIVMRF